NIPVASWEPQEMPPVDQTFLDLLGAMYQHDPVFGPALAEAIKSDAMTAAALSEDAPADGQRDGQPAPKRMVAKRGVGPKAFKALAGAAGKLLAAQDGARVAALDM